MKSFVFFVFLAYLISNCLTKPPIQILPKNPNDPDVLPEGVNKKVLIIGGGLAGLSAALELADRGYNVTIKEQFADGIGGKLKTSPFEALGETFYVEHGFHAWFHSYYQFKDIRDRLNINSNFRPWPAVHFIYPTYKPEVIYSEGPYPLNLLGIISRSPNLKLTDAIASTLSLEDLMFFDFNKVNEKYDNITFHEWAQQKKVAKSFYDIILQPALSVTLNEREIFSAAEMLSFQQVYFLTNAEADKREVATINYYEAILKPWMDHLLSKNVKIFLNTTVNSLKIDKDTLNVYGSIDEAGSDDNVYDHVVMAADIGAVQSIFQKTLENYNSDQKISSVLGDCMGNSLNKMKVAPDYKVYRAWFDKQLNSSAPDILETPDFSPINLVAQYHLLEEEFMVWANKTGGSVIEFHLYTFSKYFNGTVNDDQIWELISPTVNRIYPEIFEKNFKLLAYHVNSHKNFASFEKGLMASRPTVTTLAEKKLGNIYLAGDWIKTAYPSALMERAVSTGREAANEILIRDHVKQSSMTVVNLQGPGLFGRN